MWRFFITDHESITIYKLMTLPGFIKLLGSIAFLIACIRLKRLHHDAPLSNPLFVVQHHVQLRSSHSTFQPQYRLGLDIVVMSAEKTFSFTRARSCNVVMQIAVA